MASASVDVLRKKLRSVWPLLDERARRLMAASEALALAYGGVAAVHRACGLSRKAIAKGIREIRSKTRLEPGRIRQRGAGRTPPPTWGGIGWGVDRGETHAIRTRDAYCGRSRAPAGSRAGGVGAEPGGGGSEGKGAAREGGPHRA